MEDTRRHGDRIIAGIDGSASSTHVLKEAATFSIALGVPVEVISCWNRSGLYYAAQIPVGGAAGNDPLEAETTGLAERALERAFGRDCPKGLHLTVRHGDPAAILLEESRQAKLLMVGRRGRGGFLGMRIGSVAAACAAHARCPVLILNDEDTRQPLQDARTPMDAAQPHPTQPGTDRPRGQGRQPTP